MISHPHFLRSIAIQKRVVGALLMREVITRYGRHNIGFMWLFVEPMLFTLGITMLWSYTKAVHGSELPVVPFAVTGYSSVLLWRNAAGRCANAIEPNLSLLYHRNVRVIDLFVSRLLLEIAGGTISLIVISVIFISIGWMAVPKDILMMVTAWLLLAWFAIGLGVTIGALSEMSEMFERIWHTVTYLMFPLSGAVFMTDWLPQQARELVLWLPMVHGVEMLRHGYFGEIVTTHEDIGYFIMANFILLFFGLALATTAARQVEPE
jgi:capsular polysaccharide transport system permease protein